MNHPVLTFSVNLKTTGEMPRAYHNPSLNGLLSVI